MKFVHLKDICALQDENSELHGRTFAMNSDDEEENDEEDDESETAEQEPAETPEQEYTEDEKKAWEAQQSYLTTTGEDWAKAKWSNEDWSEEADWSQTTRKLTHDKSDAQWSEETTWWKDAEWSKHESDKIYDDGHTDEQWDKWIEEQEKSQHQNERPDWYQSNWNQSDKQDDSSYAYSSNAKVREQQELQAMRAGQEKEAIKIDSWPPGYRQVLAWQNSTCRK